MHLVTARHISISRVALCQMGAVSISVAETGGRVYYPSSIHRRQHSSVIFH